MADLRSAIDCSATRKAPSVVYSPIPIRRVTPKGQVNILKSFSLTDITQQETLMLQRRPYRSMADKSSYPSLSDAHSDISDCSIEQRCAIERVSSPDFLEEAGYLDEVLPPSRASNPQILDEEFLKMNTHNRPPKANSVAIKRGFQKYFLNQQEP